MNKPNSTWLILLPLLFIGTLSSAWGKPLQIGIQASTSKQNYLIDLRLPSGTEINLPDTKNININYVVRFKTSEKNEWRSIRDTLDGLKLRYPVESINYLIKDRKHILELTIGLAQPKPIRFKTNKQKTRLSIIFDTRVRQANSLEEEERLLLKADEALQLRRYTDAIRLYSSLIEAERISTRKHALENLGLARQKNGQLAHAKTLYKQFIDTFPEDEASARVRQRLADLLNTQFQSITQLAINKPTPVKPREEKHLFGAFNQLLTVSGNDQAFQQSPLEQSMLISSIDLSTRFKKGGSVSRLAFYSDHAYDLAEDNNEGFDIRTLFYEFRLPSSKTHLSLGRQNSLAGGLIGRFDGISSGRRLIRDWTIEFSAGFPVDYNTEDEIQKNKRFFSSNVAYRKKFYTLRPYWLIQTLDGVLDRLAFGQELDMFNADGFLRQSFDYDLHFNQANLFSVQGNYRWNKQLSSYLLVDWRRNPLLESSNALINEFRADTMLELQQILSERRILEQAKERTGTVFFISSGTTYNITQDIYVQLDATYSSQSYTLLLNDIADVEYDDQFDTSILLGISKLLSNKQDLLLTNLRKSTAKSYTNYQASIRYRFKPIHQLSLDQDFRVNLRQGQTQQLTIYRPSFKLNYQMDKKTWNQLELGYEYWQYENSLSNNYQRVFMNLVYRYVF